MGVAEDLIASARTEKKSPFTAEQRDQIAELVEHNRSSPLKARVKARDTIAALGIKMHQITFERHVRAEFGCTFGGQK